MSRNQGRQERKKALAVVRVSSDEQARKGASLESQQKWVERMEREMNLQVVKIIDEVVSGEVFPKKRFKEILGMVEKEDVTHLLVYALDRLARNLPYGAFLLQRLCEKNNVKIVTSTGVFDLSNHNQRVQVWFSLLMAEMEQGSRQERTMRGMVTKLQRGEWPLSPPFGCQRVDCQLELIPGYTAVIRYIFDTFIQTECYAETARKANDKYGEDKGFQLTDHKIKKIVQDKTYLGYLRWNGMLFGEGEEDKPKDDLKAIDRETFDRAQDVVEKIRREYSSGDASVTKKLVEKYGMEKVVEVFDLRPACPRCGSHDTQKNGSEELNDTMHLKYICKGKDCGHHFRFPGKKRQKRIEDLVSYPCDNCGSKGEFILENREGVWVLKCKNCGRRKYFYEYRDSHSKKATEKDGKDNPEQKENYQQQENAEGTTLDKFSEGLWEEQ